MEEYYQKVIQLQERLRRSEEERLKLEMKFNEMLQVMKEEEEAHFKKLRTKYKQFLEEDRRRQQRNDKVLEALDRIENRAQIWEAKTEKFKVFKRKYQDYVKHASGRRSRSPLDVERTPDPKHDTYERPTLHSEQNPKRDSGDAKTDIMEKYLQSLSSQKCKDDILQKKSSEKPPPESKYSNLGNINSVYWKSPKSGEKSDPEKEDKYDSTQLKNTKDMENALKQNNNVPLPNDYSYSDLGGGNRKFTDKSYVDIPSFDRKPLIENNYDKFSFTGRKLPTEPETKEYKFSSNISPVNQKPSEVEITRRTSQQLAHDPAQERALHVHNELENLLKQHKDEIPPFQTTLQNLPPMNPQPVRNEQFQSPPKQQLPSVPKEPITPIPRQPTQALPSHELPTQPNQLPPQIGNVLKDDQSLFKNQEEANSQILNNQPTDGGTPREPPIQIRRRPSVVLKSEFNVVQPLSQKEMPVTSVDETPEIESKDVEQRTNVTKKIDGNQSDLPQPSENQQQLDQTLQKQYDIGEQQDEPPSEQQPLQGDGNGQPSQEFDENGQYLQQYYDESGQPLQQYNENVEPIQQYDENGLPLQQYDQSGQPLQQYDQNAQPLPQYDENGQPLQPYYDENGQLQSQYYDENAQSLQKYDANGQPLQQYYDNSGQGQYDENGQPITQYDENGQPIVQYDENGQPIAQYDENGQPLIPYDPNLQVQYDENGQPIIQYDENGQPIQYDQNGQALPQYDANGQYDENGQPLQQYYDETGQPIQYYGEGESTQQFDENGQPIQQQYSEQPYGDQQQYYEQQEVPAQQPQEEQPQAEAKSNVLDILETDTESTKQDTKISNESDFDFSNG